MKKIKFEILCKDEDFKKSFDEYPCVSVVQYGDKLLRKSVIDRNKIITKSKKIEIKFDYPLTNSVTLEFRNKNGFRVIDFFKAIHDGYRKIYAMEKDPGLIPGMFNRARSEGPVGIWGHVIEDLYIEQVYETSPNKFKLSIGS